MQRKKEGGNNGDVELQNINRLKPDEDGDIFYDIPEDNTNPSALKSFDGIESSNRNTEKNQATLKA